MTKPTQQRVADLSYKIRNRLTYVMLSCDTLRFELQKVLSEEQQKEFRNIGVSGEEIRRTLDDLVGLVLAELAEPRLKEEEIALLIGG